MLGVLLLVSIFTAPTISSAQSTNATTTNETNATTTDTTSATTTTATTTNTSTTNATTSDIMGGTTTVMVMKHLCNANIKNLADFTALETGKGPVAALANTVFNCPTTGLPGDAAATGTVASPRETFGFSISGVGIPTQTLGDATFETRKVCEPDINVDINNDGTSSPATCLDTSHYRFDLSPTTNGDYIVTEAGVPANRHFGTLRFTPTEMAANNDAASLQSVDAANGIVRLRTNGDTDKMVMLHIFNFLHGTSTGGTGTTTGGMGTTTDDQEPMGHGSQMCHGHDVNGNIVFMTPGDDHGHDVNGNDVKIDHCMTGNMDSSEKNTIKGIQQLQEHIMQMQMQIIKLLQELLAAS